MQEKKESAIEIMDRVENTIFTEREKLQYKIRENMAVQDYIESCSYIPKEEKEKELNRLQRTGMIAVIKLFSLVEQSLSKNKWI